MSFDRNSDVYYGLYAVHTIFPDTYALVSLQWFDEFDYDPDKFLGHRRFQLPQDAKEYYTCCKLDRESFCVYTGETWIRGKDID